MSWWLSRPRHPSQDEAPCPEPALDVAVDEIDAVMCRVAAGDLDARVVLLEGPPAARQLAAHVNSSIDLMEAFTREANACLRATAEGRVYRFILGHGLPGMFGVGADSINATRAAVLSRDTELANRDDQRQAASREVAKASDRLSELSTSLGTSTAELRSSADVAVGVAESALVTVRSLESTSAQIQEAVNLIASVASQTRLLALNATIEAARAGDVGRGFAVVANEVKDLANETAGSSDAIAAQVEAAQQASAKAGAAIASIAEAIRQIERHVLAMADGVEGSNGLGALAGVLQGQVRALEDM